MIHNQFVVINFNGDNLIGIYQRSTTRGRCSLSRSARGSISGGRRDGYFRRSIVWLIGGRLAGTVLAQLLLVPAALAIVYVAERL